MRRGRWTLALLLFASIPAGAAAQGDSEPETTRDVELGPEEEEARALFQLAQLQFRQGRFSEAAQAFERAYALAPRPELLYNCYLSHRDAGEAPQAAAALRQLLDLPELPRILNRDRLAARLVTLEREIAERRALEERVAEQEREIQARREAAETAADAPPEPETEAPRGGTWTPGWIVLGAGGGLVAIGAVTGGAALALWGGVQSRCTGTICPPDTEGDRSAGQALTITTDVLIPVGAAAAIAGLVLALVLHDDPPPVTAACGADGCTAHLEGRF
jgi:tetratricopeptide (TPR) repeat protein